MDKEEAGSIVCRIKYAYVYNPYTLEGKAIWPAEILLTL